MDLSVAVVNYRSADYLRQCLEGWRAAVGGIDAELRIVENGTGEALETRLAGASVHVIELVRSVSLSAAVNLALRQAKGRYLGVLNPDTLLYPDSLAILLRYLDAHPDVGVVGPRVWNDPRRTEIQRSWRRFPTLSTAFFNRYSALSRLWPGNPWTRRYLMQDRSPEETQDCDWVSGCCMLIRREAFEACGGFDEGYPLYCEDVDFCRRAKQAGYRIVYHPAAEIVHHIGGSTGRVRLRSLWLRHRSMQRYVLKYTRARLLAWALVAGVWVRFFFHAFMVAMPTVHARGDGRADVELNPPARKV